MQFVINFGRPKRCIHRCCKFFLVLSKFQPVWLCFCILVFVCCRNCMKDSVVEMPTLFFSFSCHYFDTNEKCCTVKLCDCYPKWSLPKQAKLWVFHVYNATNRVCPHDKLTGEVIQFVCKWNLLSVTKDNLDFPFRCKSSLSGSGLREFFPKFRSKEFDEPVRYFHKVPGRWPRRSF